MTDKELKRLKQKSDDLNAQYKRAKTEQEKRAIAVVYNRAKADVLAEEQRRERDKQQTK